jgi:hypothetical protein
MGKVPTRRPKTTAKKKSKGYGSPPTIPPNSPLRGGKKKKKR